MDKTPEINSPSESPKIPEHWQVAVGETTDYRVIYLDKDNGYIAGLAKVKSDHYREYLVGTDGSPLIARNLHAGYWDDSMGGEQRPSAGLRKWGAMQQTYDFGSDLNLDPSLSIDFFREEEIEHESYGGSMVGPDTTENIINLIRFSPQGTLESIFMTSDKQPILEFLNKKDKFIKRDWNRGAIESLGGFRILDQGEQNKLIFVNKEGKKEYLVSWGTEVEEDGNGDKVPFFVVIQSHFNAGNEETRRIIRSPIQIDMEKVKSAVLSKPPYPKDEKGRLVVPWTNIDRIVGASLSYSYPPPKSK